ncbi:MAG TPA: hypothetical protein VGN02_04570, partial [Paenibacillus sp.]
MSFSDPWIYIVLLGLAAFVYALLLPERKSAAQAKTGANHELEATLEQYMSDIEQENGELIDLVAQMKQDFASKQLAQQEQIVELRQRVIEVELASREQTSVVGKIANSAPVIEVAGEDSVQETPATVISEEARSQMSYTAFQTAAAQEATQVV